MRTTPNLCLAATNNGTGTDWLVLATCNKNDATQVWKWAVSRKLKLWATTYSDCLVCVCMQIIHAC